MICAAVGGLPIHLDDMIVTLLREHEIRFDATAGLAVAFGRRIETCILEEPTSSQSETIAKTLLATRLNEPFLVKDSDGSFATTKWNDETNFVCVSSLNRSELINPRNKSYVVVDDEGEITAIREKVVISDLFNVGGYFFRSPQQFLGYYEQLTRNPPNDSGELYLSNVIDAMLTDAVPFSTQLVDDYRDWGTLDDWRRDVGHGKSLFVSLDGFVFERGGPFFRPRFSEVKPYAAVVESLRSLSREGVRIIYLSVRSDEWKNLTEKQLADAGLPPGTILYGCPTTKWKFSGSAHATTPFRSVDSLEIEPEHPRLLETLRLFLRG